MRLVAFTLFAVAGPAGAMQDTMVLIDTQREVRADVRADDLVTFLQDEDVADSDQAGTFIESVAASALHPEATAEASASQDSWISTDLLVAQGTCQADATAPSGGLWLSQASSSSNMRVVFEVPKKSRFHLTGSIENARVDLTGGNLDGLILMGANPDIDEAGLLNPGFYILWVGGFASAFQGQGPGTPSESSAYDIRFELEPLSGSYCTSSNHSGGLAAQIDFDGSQQVGLDLFRLQAMDSLPNQFGVFYYGSSQASVPFGEGTRCVGGSLFRLDPQVADATGFAEVAVPLGGAGAGAILPDSTWNFQWWYRDPASSSGFNLSQGLWVEFCP